ncbi:MAG TPA: AAA family ATPase [Candidatus Nanopelagicaceae bacterium]|nr:AAA family ATPase [Candidatus Nanopelagicaceae bacterium]
MSLYNKYRPKDLSEIKGNIDTVTTLQSMLSDIDSCPHSFLLHGATGCGKTTIGRIIAKELGCVGSDFKEVDSADFRGIDTIREVRKNSNFMAMEGTNRVWLIDECHKLTNDAQNALLKILEDPPKHVYFILCTTDPQKLLATIKGRCSQFQVNPLEESQMFSLLRGIARKEGEKLDKEILNQIIETSQGHPRNAIVILEQVLNADEDQRLEISKRAEATQNQIIDLCRVLIKGGSWTEIKVILAGLKTEQPESIRRVVLGYCQAILLKSQNDRAAMIIEEFWDPTYDIGFPYIVYACYSITNKK